MNCRHRFCECQGLETIKIGKTFDKLSDLKKLTSQIQNNHKLTQSSSLTSLCLDQTTAKDLS
jgi:hypothetical protein